MCAGGRVWICPVRPTVSCSRASASIAAAVACFGWIREVLRPRSRWARARSNCFPELVEHRGEVVSKDAIMEAVWPGRVVEEANLNVQIAKLRQRSRSGPQERELHPDFRRARLLLCRRRDPARGRGASAARPRHRQMRARPRPRLSIVVLPFTNLERRPGAAIFRGRHHRGSDDRSVADRGHVRDLAQYRLHLSGQAGRHQADRPRARACAMCWRAASAVRATRCASMPS